ncbi:MAG TPA: DUF2127 domain-containing protein [Candidatus Acidoferrum sp.]|nr:DUF2127 domain-containing protein [Candidatus Acidoferrum sp.]
MNGKSRLVLRAIAFFRFAKAAVLIIAGAGILHLIHRDVGHTAEHLVERFHLNPGNHYLLLVLSRVSKLTPQQLREIGLAAFFYAGLFIIEGTGLWMLRRWGEWVTVVITGSLLPFEVISIWHHATISKCGIFLINAGIVAYLAYLIRCNAEPWKV